MPWILVCNPWVSQRFYKTKIIRHLTKWKKIVNCPMIVI